MRSQSTYAISPLGRHRDYVPRSGEAPSLELRAPASDGSARARMRARLLEAPSYHPLTEPPWQLEEEATPERQGLRPDGVLSLREAAPYLGTTRAHVASLAAAGILPAEYVSRQNAIVSGLPSSLARVRLSCCRDSASLHLPCDTRTSPRFCSDCASVALASSSLKSATARSSRSGAWTRSPS